MKTTTAIILFLVIIIQNNIFSQTNKSVADEIYQELSGHYEAYYNNSYLNFEVYQKGSNFFVHLENDSPDTLFIQNIDSLKFRSVDNSKTFYTTFIKNSSGKINNVIFKGEGFEIHAARNSKWGLEFNQATKFSVKQLQEDFAILREIIETQHISMYDFTSKETFDSLFNAQNNKLNKPMNTEEFYRIISPVFGKLGCGHSWLNKPKGFLGGENMKLLPFKVSILNNKLYVEKNYDENSKIKAGSEIKSINNKSISEISNKLKASISADAFNESWRNFKLSKLFSYYYRVQFGETKQFEIDYIPYKKKNLQTETLKSIEKKDIKRSQTHKKYLSLSINNDVAVLRIEHFEYYNDRKTFDNFIDSTFKEISQTKTNNLIILLII